MHSFNANDDNDNAYIGEHYNVYTFVQSLNTKKKVVEEKKLQRGEQVK